jgi:hypothetical protein
MEKQTFSLSIEQKQKKIQLLQVVFRAIQKFQEKKSKKHEEGRLEELKNKCKNKNGKRRSNKGL